MQTERGEGGDTPPAPQAAPLGRLVVLPSLLGKPGQLILCLLRRGALGMSLWLSWT